MPKIIKKYSKTAVALLLIGILLGGYFLTSPLKVQASALTGESDVLDDSRPSATSTHTIYFITPTGVDANTDTIILDFADEFTIGSIDYTDMDLATSSDTSNCSAGTYADATLASSAAADTYGVATTTGVIITFTAPTGADTGTIIAGTCVKVEIGSNAAFQSNGTRFLTNPATAAVYDLDFLGAFGDTGKTKIAIISGVSITATVAESMNVSVNAIATSTCTTTGGTATASATTSINFMSIITETFYDSCQRIDVGTNAGSGYTANLYKTTLLTDGGVNTIADGTCNGACDANTAAAWDTVTLNGFGYCMDDVALNGAQTADASWGTAGCGAGTQNFKLIGTTATNSKTIMKSNTATSTNQAYIGYRLSVDSAQAAGTYSSTMVYIVTPTY